MPFGSVNSVSTLSGGFLIGLSNSSLVTVLSGRVMNVTRWNLYCYFVLLYYFGNQDSVQGKKIVRKI